MGTLRWVLKLDQIVDHLREAIQAEVKPHNLAEQEWIDGKWLVNGRVDGLCKGDRHICQVMDHDDKSADFLQVAKNPAKVERDCQDVVQKHLEEIGLALSSHRRVQRFKTETKHVKTTSWHSSVKS